MFCLGLLKKSRPSLRHQRRLDIAIAIAELHQFQTSHTRFSFLTMRFLTTLSLFSILCLFIAHAAADARLPFGFGDLPTGAPERLRRRAEEARKRIERINTPLTRSPQAMMSLARAFGEVAEGGCDPNVCFALDGSRAINSTNFQLQKDFVKLVAGVISLDEESQFAALQYGLRAHMISELTLNAEDFLLKVDKAIQVRNRRTFVAMGIFGCIQQLMKTPFEANHIVLLGEGKDDLLVRHSGFNAESVAKRFLYSPHNAISAVAVGFSDTSDLARIVGSPNRVFEVDEWSEVVDVTAELVENVCGLDAVEF